MQEIWKDVPGYEGRYQVSSLGRIRTIYRGWKGPVLYIKPLRKNKRGYFMVGLSRGGLTPGETKANRERYLYNWQRTFSVHRLVVLAFHGPIPTGFHVDHIDGNKENNRPENLEVVTPQENHRRAVSLGFVTLWTKDNHPRHTPKYSDGAKKQLRELFSTGEMTIAAFARTYHIPKASMYKILRSGGVQE